MQFTFPGFALGRASLYLALGRKIAGVHQRYELLRNVTYAEIDNTLERLDFDIRDAIGFARELYFAISPGSAA